MSNCKWMKNNECTNEECLFLGYSAVWCCVCKLKEPERCNFHCADGLCGYDMPDNYRKCKGYDNCKIYRILTERKSSGRK